MKFISFFLALLFLNACQFDHGKRVDRARITFSTYDDTKLFFTNVRQLYYDREELKAAQRIVYRLKDRTTTTISIYPTIVINWMDDEAYLLLEVSEQLQNEAKLVVHENDATSKQQFAYALDERGKENMLEFALKIYEGILQQNSFQVLHNGEYVPLLVDETERENFRIVLVDYLRLTRVLD